MARFGGLIARTAGPMVLAIIAAGCVPKPKPPPSVTPQIVTAEPLKSYAWKQVATDADEDRIARLGLAWQEALADAHRGFADEVR